METPKTSSKWEKPRKHVPTPKMSDRKKSLFTSVRDRSSTNIDDLDDDLGIISPIMISPASSDGEFSFFLFSN